MPAEKVLSAVQLRAKLRSLSKSTPEQRHYLQQKQYRTTYEVLGLSVPVQRSLLKRLKQKKTFPLKDSLLLKVWRESSCFEVLSLLLFHFQGLSDLDLKKKKNTVLSLCTKIENWAHSDLLASMLSRLRELEPALMERKFVEWGKSRSFWKNRLALTSLFYYASARESYPSFALVSRLIRQHLSSEDYYVQKALGWTLRECEQIYSEKTRTLIEKNILLLSTPAFSAATEKVPMAFKLHLKELRKARKRK